LQLKAHFLPQNHAFGTGANRQLVVDAGDAVVAVVVADEEAVFETGHAVSHTNHVVFREVFRQKLASTVVPELAIPYASVFVRLNANII